MIPLRTKILLLFLITSLNSFSQDFYDHDNSFKFGEYLYQSNQNDLAVREFERCVFLKPDDRKSFLYLFKIYRQSNDFSKAIASYSKYSDGSGFTTMDQEFGSEYFKLLVQNNKFSDAKLFIDSNSNFNQNIDLKISTHLLNKEWKEAYVLNYKNNNQINSTLTDITNKSQALKNRSQALAAIFSAIIPGSGKVYAGRWKDGLISFLMTSTTTFIAVKGLRKNPNSFYPWAMGTLSVVYYTGNIYGSANAVYKRNKQKEDELVNKTRDFILINN
jgi:tetratricopeptide (TPR) repeat protein